MVIQTASWQFCTKLILQSAVGHHSFPFVVVLLQGVSWEWLHTTLVNYPILDVQLLKRCLQKNASVVFGILDPFSMTEFIFTRLKGAEHRDWMHSRQYLRLARETGDLSLPGIIDVVSIINGVWPLIVSDLKETGKKDSGDSLVVWIFLLVSFPLYCRILFTFCCLEKRDRWILLHQSAGQNQIPSVLCYPRNVLVFTLVAMIE